MKLIDTHGPLIFFQKRKIRVFANAKENNVER